MREHPSDLTVDYNYRCSTGHTVISSDHQLDETQCPARYEEGIQCIGTLDGPYVDILVFLFRLKKSSATRELAEHLQSVLGIDYL